MSAAPDRLAQSEDRQTRAHASADDQALEVIDRRHDRLQDVPAGALGQQAAREAANSDAKTLIGFTDKVLQGRAAAVMGETADQHTSYKAALLEASPEFASLADRAFAEDQQKSAAKEARKSREFADRRDDAAAGITARYENLARAGLSISDLQGPALERLARLDSRDVLLTEGYPPHLRAGEVKALVAESLKVEGYRATFDREYAEWAAPEGGRWSGVAESTRTIGAKDRADADSNIGIEQPRGPKASEVVSAAAGPNSIRSIDDSAEKSSHVVRPVPPLEDRFNVMRTGLVEKEYRFRDQTGKIAFTDKLMSISTASESPAAIKAMVDRAAERGWAKVSLKGSPEFVRQAWIAADAQGLKAVGHRATPADRDAAVKERARLDSVRKAGAPGRLVDGIDRVQTAHVERAKGARGSSELSAHRRLGAAIEKALIDGKVSPEIRSRVSAAMAAEGTRRVAKGERVNVPVYDPRAPSARSKSAHTVANRPRARERSR